MSDQQSLTDHFHDALNLSAPSQHALQKKTSQRFTVQRVADSYALDRTLSSDSTDSHLYYPSQGPPPFFNPVIARPMASPTNGHYPMISQPPPSQPYHYHHQPPTPTHPQQNAGPFLQQPGGLLPGQEDATDEVIPTAIVIKNIPFSVPRDQVIAIMESLNLVLPYAFNYHYDVAGLNQPSQFRGLAFANFRDPSETSAALAALNGYEIQGRRLRVEYKRMLRIGEKEKIEREKALKRMRSAAGLNATPHAPPPMPHGSHEYVDFAPSPAATGPDVWNSSLVSATTSASLVVGSPSSSDLDSSSTLDPSSSVSQVGAASRQQSLSKTTSSQLQELDMNDPQTLEIYSRVLLFKDDAMRDELAFARSLTGIQRRIVHLVAQRLGLGHKSVGEGDERHAVVYKTSSAPANEFKAVRSAPPSNNNNNLRGKKSMPDMRPPPSPLYSTSQHAATINSHKSNNDLRTTSRRERPSVQGAFHVPPVPTLTASPTTSSTSTTHPYGADYASAPSPTMTSGYRQPRGATTSSSSSSGRSNQENWRRGPAITTTTADSLDDL